MAVNPSAPPETPTIGTAAEAATILRVHKSQVYRLMDQGVIESRRVGGRRFVIWDSVVRLLVTDPSEAGES